MNIKDPEKIVIVATKATLVFMVCCGLILVVAQIKPFWVDEWRVIYNLKFKTTHTIWGPLDYMQQFPRVYLSLIQRFTAAFDYSYLTLRLPSFLIGSFAIWFCYRLMRKLYPDGHFNRYLFVMVLVSCSTFTEYFVQIKQYTMDILLSLVVIGQLVSLLEIKADKKPGISYMLLCVSLAILPFFSYTYPVAVAPVYGILLINTLVTYKSVPKKLLLLQWLPLALCTASIVVFYLVDVKQLMADGGMRWWWRGVLMEGGFHPITFIENFFLLFAQVGSGFVFWIIFGILGICSFLTGIRRCIGYIGQRGYTTYDYLKMYSVLLLLFVLTLFVAGKLPVGEPRLNAFTIPAITILIISFLDGLALKARTRKFSIALSVLLYAGVIGNIYTTFYAGVTGPEYARKLNIYQSTETALVLAQAKHLPIFITPDVAYPYDKTQNLPFNTTVPGDWVLKTFPAYKVAAKIPVYAIKDMGMLAESMKQLPPSVTTVMVGDGKSFHIVKR